MEYQLIHTDKRVCLHDLLVDKPSYHAPCGGSGTCKKCKVRLLEEIPYTEVEKQCLTEAERQQHVHLACMTYIEEDVHIIQEEQAKYQIAQNFYQGTYEPKPIIKRKSIDLATRATGSIPDWCEWIYEQVGVSKISLDALRKLTKLMGSDITPITLIYDEEQVLNVVEGRQIGYGIAIDIGTTTVVAYLYDLSNGGYLGHVAGLNEQKSFGSDVISRIRHAHKEEGLSQLSYTIVTQLNGMIEEILYTHHLQSTQLDVISVVGNTTMMYLLLGISPKSLGIAPFECPFTTAITYTAFEIGLIGEKHCQVLLMPHIAAYVGSDIISGVIATDLKQAEDCALLLDMGTNGEMVLKKGNKMYCCATAAGPAFEGAKIECGVGGTYGAINKVCQNEGRLSYTTIGEGAPIGLCGSGIIDAVAYLLDQDIVDETGYLKTEECFIVAYTKEGSPIFISQKDIREVQLAKAAICAGVETLLKETNTKINEIKQVYLAGGFGQFMDQESAIKIGILPKDLQGKITTVGNTAGIGAAKLLLGDQTLKECMELREVCTYIELSTSPIFSNAYIQNMSF